MSIPGSMKMSTVFKRLSRAHFSIFAAIIVYIGLIVSDPATSPFYAIESALNYVGHEHVVKTMMVVLLIAVSVSIGYAAIGMRFNKGEGGTGLVFEWLGPKAAMGVGTIIVVLLFTSFVTYDIASTAASLTMQPDHHHTLFSLWTRAKLGDGPLLQLLSLSSISILLSGAASGATAGGGMVHVLVKSKILPKWFTHVDNEHNDYKAMLVVHTVALLVVIMFGVKEQSIVAFYAISVLIGFCLSLFSAIKFAVKSKTTYLFAAIPGLLMVILALLINLARMEGIIILVICLLLGTYLYKRWIEGGKQPIDFSH